MTVGARHDEVTKVHELRAVRKACDLILQDMVRSAVCHPSARYSRRLDSSECHSHVGLCESAGDSKPCGVPPILHSQLKFKACQGARTSSSAGGQRLPLCPHMRRVPQASAR